MVLGVLKWVKSRLFSSENIEEKLNPEQHIESESETAAKFENCSKAIITEYKALPEKENLLIMDTELTGSSGKKEKPSTLQQQNKDNASCSHHKGDVIKSAKKQSTLPENKIEAPAEKKSSDASVKSYVDRDFSKNDSDSEDLDTRNPDSIENLLQVTQNKISDIPLLDNNFWTWTPEVLKQFLASKDKTATFSDAHPDREMEQLMERLIKMMGKKNQEKMEEFEKQVESTIKNVKAHLEKHKDK